MYITVCTNCKSKMETNNKKDYLCKKCKKEYMKKYCEANKEKIAKQTHLYYIEHEAEIKNRIKQDYIINRESKLSWAREYYNSHKKECKAYSINYNVINNKNVLKKKKEYRKNNKEKIDKYRKNNMQKFRLYGMNRLAAKLKRTPKWITKEEMEAIKQFYINCPKDMTVDHIIPMQGKNISGLHVLKNLQYLSAVDNSKKGNKFPYYPLQFYKDKSLILRNIITRQLNNTLGP